MTNHSQRNTGLDVIRCVALFSVVAVHLFLNTGFYQEIVAGPVMQLFIYLRSALMISIPLFLMLSGYLLCSKKLSKSYYLRIIRILFVYVCTSIFCGIFRILVTKDGLTVLDAILGIFSFSTLSYSWYIEMYLGLFLLIPFLNILWHGLENQKQKQWLVLTLLVLTAAPSMVNIYRFDSFQWWLSPADNAEYHQLIPDWWSSIYPLTCYYIGSYLREYPLKMKHSRYLPLILLTIFLSGTFNYYRSHGSLFVWGLWQNWRSASSMALSILLFSWLEGGNYQKLGKIPGKVVSLISELSLGAYLFSQTFDLWLYPILNTLVPNVQARLPYILVAVPVVLTLSLAFSWVLHILYRDILAKAVDRWMEKRSV